MVNRIRGNTSIRRMMAAILLGFALLVTVSVIVTFWGLAIQSDDAQVINLAGRQRMLVQEMTRLAIDMEHEHGPQPQAELTEAIAKFDSTLQALIYGGLAPYTAGTQVSIPSAPARIQPLLLQVSLTWQPFSQALSTIQQVEPGSPEFQARLDELRLISPQLVQQTDTAARAYTTAASQGAQGLRLVQISFLAAALGLLALGWIATRRQLILPVEALNTAARRIEQGDLETPVEASGPAEIRLLGETFEQMRKALLSNREQSAAWAETLEEQVQMRTLQLDALYEVSQEISSRLDLRHVLGSVTQKAQALLGSEVAFICLLDPEQSGLKLRAQSGPLEAVKGVFTSLENRLAQQILMGSCALHCGSGACVGDCQMIRPEYRQSHLAAPLRVGSRTIGALCVASSEPGCFNGEDAVMLTRLASAAAVALENARLYGEAERAAMLDERQRIAADMHDGLAQTLGFLGLAVDRVSDAPPVRDDSELSGLLERLRAGISKANEDVRGAIANLREGPPPTQSLQEQLAGLVQGFQLERLSWSAPETPPIYLSKDMNEQILHIAGEAIHNAVRHSGASRIEVSLIPSLHQVVLGIADNGSGFDPFLPPSDGKKHFGLDIMRARASQMGGTLTIETQAGQGACITLTIPVGGVITGASRVIEPLESRQPVEIVE